MIMGRNNLALSLLAWLVCFACLSSPASGQGKKDKSSSSDMSRGDYFFKAGYYLKASESYRVAILDQPRNTERLLSFANALFALGNYHYSSHAVRRAVKYLPKKASLDAQVSPMFPSRLNYVRALDDLKRYVTYNRRDPSALTVLSYTYYSDGEYKKATKICGYLKLLDREDPYVRYMTVQIAQREKEGGLAKGAEDKPDAKVIVIEPIEPKNKPKSAIAELPELPDTKPMRERAKLKKSKPAPAVSE
jgi:tetratricopeptide (TPR) repeat protein